MSDPFVGEIRMFAGTFAPQGWAFCQGQLLAITQNEALFSLLGTTYGGNGTSNFALPDLRGRVPVSFGQGTGLPNYNLGQVGGATTATLTTANLPAHTHTFAQNVSNVLANVTDPTTAIPAQANAGGRGAVATLAYTQSAPTSTFPAQNTSAIGSNQPVSIEPPFLVLNFIIALLGIYPSRS